MLYGLPVYHRRRVSFGRQDPARARELFIRGALVDGEFDTKLAFFAHNRKLLADIEQLEHKSRRQDVLVDDELIFGFYEQAIPEGIYTGASFERWYKDEVKKSGQSEDKLRLLYLSRDDLMRHAVGPQPLVRRTEIPFSIDDRLIILVDDVLYTGRTTRAALDALIDFGRPRAIQLVTLVDRGHRELPIKADYVGKNIPTARNEAVQVRLQELDGVDEVVVERQE